MHAALAQVRHSLTDVISSKKQCRRFVINDTLTVLARALLQNRYLSAAAEKTLLTHFRRKVNHIGSLQRKMTLIDAGHVGM